MKSMQKMDKLKIGEASRYIGRSVDSLRRWERQGKITAQKTASGTRFYFKEDLDNMKLPISKAAKRIGVSVKTLRRWDKSDQLVASRDGEGHRVYDPRRLFKPSTLTSGYFLTKRQKITSALVLGLVIVGVGFAGLIGSTISPLSSSETTIKPQFEASQYLTKILAENQKYSYIYNNVGEIKTPPVPQSHVTPQMGGEVGKFNLNSFNTVSIYPKVSNTNIEYINQSSSENLHLAQ